MTTTIPFQILSINDEGFHLLLKLHINGKVANVIIDTGASRTVFDKTRIKKYVTNKSFEKHDQMTSGIGTNTMESHTTVLKKIKIRELIIDNYEAVLLDLSHVNESYHSIGLLKVEGVLGSDILLEYNAIINYKKQTLTLEYKKSKK